jgi:peptide/nickel transport system substrate-binding protein
MNHQVLWLVVVLVVTVTASCDRDRDPSAAKLSTLTISVPRDESSLLSPARRGSASFLVFLPLATPNERGELEGQLAESWEHTPGSRQWAIRLRPDVRWHDGMPVTAHDVKFTVDLFARPEVRTATFNTGLSQIESVEVLDDTNFILTYAPGSVWHYYWYPGPWQVFYPKHLLENLDPAKINEWEFWKHPVGNGPFRYLRHTPKTMMEFEANADFYPGKPKIDRVVIKFAPASLVDLLAGKVDTIHLENPAAVRLIKDDPRFRVYYESWDDISALVSLIWNHRNPLFFDPRVRRAMAHAINRNELRLFLNMWEELAVVDAPFTETQYWNRDLPEPLAYDPELAQRLLEEAGWRDVGGDGVRQREGRELRFEMIIPERQMSLAVYVQQQLNRVGIHVEILTLDRGAHWERTYDTQNFEVSLAYVWVSPDDDDMGLVVMLGENSKIGYHNPEVIRLINAAQEARDEEALSAIYQELAPIVQQDQPFTFLIFGVEAYAAHRRVKGMSSPFRANALWSAGQLWIEDESQRY